MLRKLIFCHLFVSILCLKSQVNRTISEQAKVSIITSGPGHFLYEKFGHSAIRIKDKTEGYDLIYNYGIFDFSGSNFYMNFIKGYMNYKLVSYPFEYALANNRSENRWVREQVLNLTFEQKKEFFEILEKNSLIQNASYLYDPFFNNCATKPRDIINKVLGNRVRWNANHNTGLSFRQLMNHEIHQNTWGNLGINIALGSPLDKKAAVQEYFYLPDYLSNSLSLSKVEKEGSFKPLVIQTNMLVDLPEIKPYGDTLGPLLFSCILLILVLFITLNDVKKAKRTKWLDFTLLFTTGLVGVIIVFLWFFTSHSTAPRNYNILWGFAPNLILSFYSFQSKSRYVIKRYSLFLLLLMTFLPIIWLLEIQLFNWALIPFFIALWLRYFFIVFRKIE